MPGSLLRLRINGCQSELWHLKGLQADLHVELGHVCPYTKAQNKQQSKEMRDNRRGILLFIRSLITLEDRQEKR